MPLFRELNGTWDRIGGGEPAPSTERPTGADYQRYEDIYVSGDSVAAAMARCTPGKIITFPEGRFEMSDFTDLNDGYLTAITIPKKCKGIWGSGQGSLGSSDGTVFTMKPNTSTKKSLVPAQDNSTPVQMRLMKQTGADYAGVFKHFRVEGTEQGHIYHDFTLYNPKSGTLVEDILVTGWYGNNGAPPGETFGLEIHGGNNHILRRVEGDGRRIVGGPSYGAVPITIQNSVGTKLYDCFGHHAVAANLVLFQTFDVETFGLILGDRSTQDGPGGIDGWNDGWLNHERTAGTIHHSPRIFKYPRGRGAGVNISHSNDGWGTSAYDGVQRSVTDGSLTIIDPVFTNLQGNGRLYIQSWNPYWTGDTMVTPPLVTKADGVTHLPYTWIQKNIHQLVN